MDIIKRRIHKKFEDKFNKIIKCKNSVSVNSETSAIILSLLSIGINPGDEIIVPNYIYGSLECYSSSWR